MVQYVRTVGTFGPIFGHSGLTLPGNAVFAIKVT